MTEAEVIDRINSTIKKNGKNAITGEEMNFVLKAIIQLIADAGGTVNWGDIEGTIADQVDLYSALNNKVDVVSGKGLSTNDFTNTLKTKLDGIEAGAEVNVKADWTATSGDAEILNKPTIPDASDFVAKSDYTPAHSILAQQSGTGSPTAVSIGNNEILGRKSGGGSDIEGLSVSDVKAILDLEGTNTGDNFILTGAPVQGNSAVGGAVRYYGFSDNVAATVETSRRTVITKDTIFKGFYLRTSGTQPASGSYVLTILKNGVATGITITIPAGSSAGVFSDITHSFSVVAADEISIEAVNNASATSAILVTYSIGVL